MQKAEVKLFTATGTHAFEGETDFDMRNNKRIPLILDTIQRSLPLLMDANAIKAMVTWPKFSITAYAIVSDLFKQGIRPKTVIDVGANTGQFTVAACNIFKGVIVHAFEPIEKCVDRLRANTSRYKNIHIHPVALGDDCKTAAFHMNNYSLASSLLRLSDKHQAEFSQATERETVSVAVRTLDSNFFDKPLAAPVLMKLDVQGAERMVIEGGRETLQRVDYILMETSFSPMYIGEPCFTEMIDVMRMRDFDLVRPMHFLRSPRSGEILQADILFRHRNR